MIRATMQPAALSQRQRVQKQRGFTLIEVLVASLLLMIVLIPLLGIFISSVSASLKAETENAASLLAQEQIEELRGLNYASLTLDSNPSTGALVAADSDIDTSDGSAKYVWADATYNVVWADATYNVVAEKEGSVDPRPEPIDRRNVSFTVQRYILWVDDPTDNDTSKDYKKALVEVSWESPQPGSMTFETNIHQKGSDSQERPGVRITFPYIGDAFHSGDEIATTDSDGYPATITADAWDRDGHPVQVLFEYKMNIDANFSNIGTDYAGIDPSSDGTYEYSINSMPSLSARAQVNLRAIVTGDDGLTGTVCHPIFIDRDAPQQPDDLTKDITPSWPPTFAWTEVEDYIDKNTNYNMVVGYLVIRDVLPSDVSPSAERDPTTTALAYLSGSDQTSFRDVTDATPLDPSVQVRYRIRSLGRADYWYDEATKDDNLGVGAGSVPETVTSWMNITAAPDSTVNATNFDVSASATSWSAISLTWAAQKDGSGEEYDNLYLIYRDVVVGADGWKLVGTVSDPADEAVEYVDTHLERKTAYKYKITAYSPDWSVLNNSDSVEATTSIY